MNTRTFIVAAAMALAALLLVLTFAFGPSASGPAKRDIEPAASDDWRVNIDPSQRRVLGPHNPITAGSKGIDFRTINERGQLYHFYGEELTPLPQGQYQVQQPGAKIYLTPTRVIDIRAREGTFVAPENQVRSGVFRRDVRVALFEGRPGQKLDLEWTAEHLSPDLALVVELDEAEFDVMLGELKSTGPVRLTSRRAEFQGNGLVLRYSEKERRVERLEVAQGKELRLRSEANPGAPEAPRPARQPAPAGTEAAPEKKPTEARMAQFYRATFDRNVRITGRDLDAQADSMELLFSAFAGADSDSMLRQIGGQARGAPGARAGRAWMAAADPLRGVLMLAFQALLAQTTTPATAPAATLFERSEEDLIVTWSGPLTVRPEDAPPAHLAGPNDVLLTMAGAPLQIRTGREDVVKAERLEYQAGNEHITLLGTPERPFVVDSPALGLLSGQTLALDQHQGTGQLVGAGSLRAHGEPGLLEAVDRAAPLQAPQGRLPRGFSVAWSERLDLDFYLRGEEPRKPGSNEANPTKMRAIRSADFRGDVDVQHPAFAVQSQRLRLDLQDVPGKDGAAKPQTAAHPTGEESIQAWGQVHVVSRDAQEDKQFALDAEQLTIDLERDEDGQLQPRRLRAQQDVVARQPGRVLRVGDVDGRPGTIDVALVPAAVALTKAAGAGGAAEVVVMSVEFKPEPQGAGLMDALNPFANVAAVPPATQSAGGVAKAGKDEQRETRPKMDVQLVVAEGNVQIDIDEQQTQVRAQRLVADVPADKMQLWGSEQTPARVSREDGSLTGPHIVLSQKTQSAQVEGAGRFEFVSAAPPRAEPAKKQADAARPAVPERAAREEKPQTRVTVTWKRAMQFDNSSGMAHFSEAVRCDARSGQDTAKLYTDDLRLRFTQAPPAKDEEPSAEPAKARGGMFNRFERGTWAVTEATALGNVIFEAESWPAAGGERADTLVRLEGPQMNFDNVSEQIQVPGAGQMLVADYRGKPSQADDAGTRAAVGFTGRGATLFKWTGKLVLDALHNDMLINDTVQMFHVPMDATKGVQLDCRKFVADMEATGGLGVWLSSRTPQPRIKAVYADGDVRILSEGRQASTDHLEYIGTEERLVLRADEGRMTDLIEPGKPSGLRAEQISWDLKRDRITVEKPGAVRAPLAK